MELYLYAYAGMLLYLILDLYGLQEATPHLNFGQTVSEYFRKNTLIIIAGALILFLIVSLSASGEGGFLQSIGINIQAGKGGALVVGLTIQTLLTAIRRIIRPIEVKTSGDKVVTPPKEN